MPMYNFDPAEEQDDLLEQELLDHGREGSLTGPNAKVWYKYLCAGVQNVLLLYILTWTSYFLDSYVDVMTTTDVMTNIIYLIHFF